MTEPIYGHSIPLKSICIPGVSPVDVSEYLPILDHPLVQPLRFRKQLGVNHLVFPGAVHTRLEHAIGVLALTQRLCQIQHIPKPLTRCLCACSLLHDVGHGPFSHQVEPILTGNHKERGLGYLQEMEEALEKIGADPDEVTRLFTGEHPLGQFIHDRNLGTDKLDYLRRDALHIGFTGMPDIEKIQLYTMLDNGVLAIEEKFLEDIKRVQKFYSYLHQHGYLNKTALSVQRILQRAVQEELSAENLRRREIWSMTDMELMNRLRRGGTDLGRRLVEMLWNRQFHRTAVVIKPTKYGFAERRSSKRIVLREWSRGSLRKFSRICSSYDRLVELEDKLSKLSGLERGDVLFAAMPYFRKLVPKDVRIFCRQAGDSFWLFDKDRDHYRSLKGDYLRTFAIRVTAPPGKREKVLERSDAITDFIEAQIT